ncbi:unnamed protein product [Caenorhabditis angaria]|uniref:Serpentine receptor class gamma n=1 Tax=Caenorhabditis angaria TaxID=860376 RepID=A0A9P1IW97_9PELO|nr:unnamed protein product [Caenorhabditis angaria]
MDGADINQSGSCSVPDVSETSKLIKMIIQLSYILPLTYIYIKFLVTVSRKNSIYSDTFFTLYIVDGVSSIGYIIVEFSIIRMMNFFTSYCEWIISIFCVPTYLLTPYFYLYLFFQFMKIISTVTLCANRFTSVFRPVAHNYIWKTYLRHIIITQIIVSALFSTPTLTGPAYASIYQNQPYINYVHNIPYFRTTVFRLIIMIPSLIFIIVSNIIIISKLSKISSNMRKLETSMVSSTIFISFGFILVLMLSVIILVISIDFANQHPGFFEVFALFNQIANDFYMISGPVVLLILDENIRKSILRCSLKPRRGSITQVHTITG